MAHLAPASRPWQRRFYKVVFLSGTPAGKAFDVLLIGAILLSVGVVMLDSVEAVRRTHFETLRAVEWVFTLLFTAEYVVRLAIVRHPARYAGSFFGVVDVLSVLPTYISLIIPGAQVLLVVRILRVLRVFRVLKLAHYLDEAEQLRRALSASRRKILVFITVVLTMVTILGSLMYLVEGPEGGFTSIPRSVYWAVVTLTTVGYGDISPVTNLGQAISTIIMLLGYGILAVPTGIVTVELNRESQRAQQRQCTTCNHIGHDADAEFCKHCGTSLPSPGPAHDDGTSEPE